MVDPAATGQQETSQLLGRLRNAQIRHRRPRAAGRLRPRRRATPDKIRAHELRLDHLEAVSILWQGGYLTFDDPEPRGDRYTLRYPNEEVRRTFFSVLLDLLRLQPCRRYAAGDFAWKTPSSRAIFETFAEQVDAILAAVPYQLWQDATERFYHAVLLTAFRYIGTFEVQAEVSSARGRADVVLLTERYVYAIEFKLLRPTAAQLGDEVAREAGAEALVGEALAQIAERGYLDAYRGGEREAIAIGVAFDAERRKVAAWREA